MTKKMTNMNFDELAQEAFATAKAHGWHDTEQPDEHWLMLIITEIAEAVQADRKDKHADVAKFKEYQTYYGTFLPSEEIRTIRFREDFEAYIKNSVEDELSDVVIRCLDLAGLRNIEFDYALKLMESGMKKVNKAFPVFMYECCADISNGSLATLARRLNVIVAAIICYCQQKKIDIEFFIEQKMKYNKLRPFRHGNKKY